MPLYLLFNLFTLFIILVIAKLNNTFIESIFITISFWANKKAFGKPYHCKSVITCFMVSSLTYFCLTRITISIGITYLVPIILGVLLSYFTASLVEERYENRLYKGMSEEDLMKIVTKVTNNKLDIKMCKEFYCDRYNSVKVANINNYSISAFEKRKKKIVDKVKALRN